MQISKGRYTYIARFASHFQFLKTLSSSGPNFCVFLGATPKQTGRNIVLVEGVRTPFLMAGTRQV